MRASDIEARAVAKIVLVALFWAALAVLLAIAILHTRTTLRWVITAVFLALALDPAVALIERIPLGKGRQVPRVAAVLSVLAIFLAGLVFLCLHVIPPMVKDIEGLAKSLPTYVNDFEDWAENNEEFQSLNDKYHITQALSEQASRKRERAFLRIAGAKKDGEQLLIGQGCCAKVAQTLPRTVAGRKIADPGLVHDRAISCHDAARGPGCTTSIESSVAVCW